MGGEGRVHDLDRQAHKAGAAGVLHATAVLFFDLREGFALGGVVEFSVERKRLGIDRFGGGVAFLDQLIELPGDLGLALVDFFLGQLYELVLFYRFVADFQVTGLEFFDPGHLFDFFFLHLLLLDLQRVDLDQ